MNLIFVTTRYSEGYPTVTGPFSSWKKAYDFIAALEQAENSRSFKYDVVQHTVAQDNLTGEPCNV